MCFITGFCFEKSFAKINIFRQMEKYFFKTYFFASVGVIKKLKLK